jgi:hypothetical protein
VLEALAASCTQLAAGWGRRAAYNVACDALVAALLLTLHGATLMSQVKGGCAQAARLGGSVSGHMHGSGGCGGTAALHLMPLRCKAPPMQAMVFGVAMNSKKNTLVALLIAANFTEIKGERRRCRLLPSRRCAPRRPHRVCHLSMCSLRAPMPPPAFLACPHAAACVPCAPLLDPQAPC